MRKTIYSILLFVVSLVYAVDLLPKSPVVSGIIFGILISTVVVYALTWYSKRYLVED